LAVIILAFGALLTIALPWNFVGLMNGPELRSLGTFQKLWFASLALLSFVILVRWCVVQSLAFRAQFLMNREVPYNPTVWPSVSILVPAFQEAENIESALRSLVELDYPRYEIIVVDDGSSDATFEKARTFAGPFARGTVRVLRKENGGKWSALNLGFQHARGDLILCIDADSRLSWDALKLLVPHMRDPAVAAVSGQVTVRNRVNLLTKLQALEYIISNGGLRTAQSHLGAVLVVPGPIGLYRRLILEEIADRAGKSKEDLGPGEVAGPLSDETFAEDFQLSLTALALSGRIVYEPRAIAYTRAPDKTQQLINQRYRWLRGTMQVLDIYKSDLRALSSGPTRRKLDAVLNGLYLVDIYLLPLVSFVVLLGFLVTIANADHLGDVVAWVIAIWLLNLMSSTYYILSQGDDLSLLTAVPALDLYQCLLINSAWIVAAVDQLRKSRMQW
jgi:cellulose synthase/poly-beta-1,6-N-acetylglucosamine synthase-like glycosyltransferase